MELEFFQIPDSCPSCSGPTVVDGDFLYCRSPACPSRLSGAVKAWVKRLGLLHWGDAFVDSLTDPENPRVSTIADLYRLSVDDMADCCSGRKMAQKCWEVLHGSKSVPLELMLAGLNIPNFGISTATDIVASGLDTVDRVLSASFDDFLKVPNVGPATARHVYDGLQDKRSEILDLASVLDLRKPVGGPLSGRSFCITGATSRPRKAVQKDILAAGGLVKESVVKGLSFLVTNEDASFGSSKMQKARKLGVSVVTESDLYSMLSSGTHS